MRQVKSFVRNKRANASVTFALVTLPVLGISGAAVDYSQAARARSNLQEATDAAALSAVQAATLSEQTDLATRVFHANNITPNARLTVTSTQNGRLTVRATAVVKTAMLGIINVSEIGISAQSSAQKDVSDDICVLGLSRTAPSAVSFAGNTSFEAVNCAVHSNAQTPEGLSAQGSATARAKSFCSSGGINNPHLFSPRPRSCYTVADPFAGTPLPDLSGCTRNNVRVGSNRTENLTPGTYCGGLDIKGTANLAPGTYIVNGSLEFGSQAVARGTGVTFIITGLNASLKINGGATVDITAPTSGDLKGMAFIQDRTANPGADARLNGGQTMRIQGAIYLPTQTLLVTGDSNIQLSAFMPIVADRIEFSGSSTIRAERQASGGLELPKLHIPRLIY